MPAPPPPRTSTRLSRRTRTRGLNTAFNPYGFVIDPAGRRDTAGHPVPFYPSVRAAMPGQTQSHQASAYRPPADSAPKQNPQKDPFKGLDTVEGSGN